MRLFVEPMDAFVIEVSADGLIRYEATPGAEIEGWSKPSLQERRAIIFSARQELAALTELLDILDGGG